MLGSLHQYWNQEHNDFPRSTTQARLDRACMFRHTVQWVLLFSAETTAAIQQSEVSKGATILAPAPYPIKSFKMNIYRVHPALSTL